ARTQDVGAQHVGVDARAFKQVGLGGPAGAAGIAAVGGGDQVDQGGDVGFGGRAEGGGLHGGSLRGGGSTGSRLRPAHPSSRRTLRSAARNASISSCVL